jgi:glyoxylate/hydroxypyruvate reductase A
MSIREISWSMPTKPPNSIDVMKNELFHIHFNSRRDAHPVFHMTPDIIKAALARRGKFVRKIQVSVGWDLENAPKMLKSASMLVTSMQVPRENLRKMAPQLRAIHLIGAGVEYLRPFDWLPKGVSITNNRGIHRQKAGEYILMCILMLNNRIPELMNAQASREWRPLFTTQLKGKTLLVIGAGHLGGAGAREARRSGLHVIGVRRGARRHRDCDEVIGPEMLNEYLPRADFVVVAVPSTSETDGMIGARQFALMKKTAGFLNFARAQVVDYDALVDSLRKGRLGGAILDVFDPEPLPRSSPLWKTPNLLITPHCSSDDLVNYMPMTLDLVLENAERMLKNRKLLNLVNVNREY